MIMTEAAISKWRVLIKELDLNEEETHLRLAIKGGGCSGFIKELDYCQTKDIGDRDLIEKFSDVKVVVDFKSMMFYKSIPTRLENRFYVTPLFYFNITLR